MVLCFLQDKEHSSPISLSLILPCPCWCSWNMPGMSHLLPHWSICSNVTTSMRSTLTNLFKIASHTSTLPTHTHTFTLVIPFTLFFPIAFTSFYDARKFTFNHDYCISSVFPSLICKHREDRDFCCPTNVVHQEQYLTSNSAQSIPNEHFQVNIRKKLAGCSPWERKQEIKRDI